MVPSIFSIKKEKCLGLVFILNINKKILVKSSLFIMFDNNNLLGSDKNYLAIILSGVNPV